MYKRREEMTEDERARADTMDVRCLDLCIGMLERIHGVRAFPSLSLPFPVLIRVSYRRLTITRR